MGAYTKTVVTCYMTPEHLRSIADNMERIIGGAKWGDDLNACTWFGKNCEVRFVVDQERIREVE